jgi:hypothetical protein
MMKGERGGGGERERAVKIRRVGREGGEKGMRKPDEEAGLLLTSPILRKQAF